jgi:Zn-dependent M28 family amino/carboxypeptidase
MKKYLLIPAIAIAIICCKSDPKENTPGVQVNETSIGTHIEELSSDSYLGRMPFTEGETKTVNYLKEEFIKLGVQPGNGDSFFQEVPLVEITGTPSEKMMISGGKDALTLDYLTDFVALTQKIVPEVELNNSELVFAGYGIVAPEYGWNDYKGIDWKGKTAVVLINDPGFKSGDNSLFKGNTMTYYGRWTYKYEEAARQGAAGVLIIHETQPASYGWNVVQSSWSGARMNLESKAPQTDVQGWIRMESAKKLFEASPIQNKNYNELAKQKNFKPVALGLNANLKITNTIKKDVSRNVVALIPGTYQKDEYIIYSAHWDHLGVGIPVNNDSIYNGAVDNASGTACLLAIAEAFKKMPPTKRSIVFIAVTAEEQGLLGSAFYAENPIYNPKKTVANINMDALSSPGPMKDLTITGFGHSEMDDYAKTAADKQGRYIIPDPKAEKGYFFRSDHFNFAKIGIPALYASGTYEDFKNGVDFVKKMNEDYEKNKYHQPADEYVAGETALDGIQFDAQLLFHVGLQLANETKFPKWYDTSEFKAAREKE